MDKDHLKSLKILSSLSIKEAMNKLNDNYEKILFVTESDNRLIGIVMDGDIRRAIVSGETLHSKVEDIMQRSPIALFSREPDYKSKAKELMMQKKIEHVPVLDSEGKIEDVVLWTDFLGNNKKDIPKKYLNNQVVIMAGGKGSRLDPFTRIFPKPLIPVGNKAAIEIIMDSFSRCGFHRFIYSLNYRKEYLKLFLKEKSFPYEIDLVEEKEFLGTAGSLYSVKDKIDDTFFVVNCDSLLDLDFEDVLNWHREHKAAITIIGSHMEVNIPFGVLEISNGILNKISEKPVHDVFINTGVYVMERNVLSYFSEEKPLDMNQLIDIVAKKEKVGVYPIYKGWFDLGQWEEYKKTAKHFKGTALPEEI